ncbi:glutamate racemase [Thalassotalea aquiviva]|uniref:glutamate racemase n=1 Tax=Thalassotalea aquiviva TaxID=3242415 RepID=UPI00352A9C71
MTCKTAPIGVFDSGVGGLSILKGITQILPNEDVLYVGDTKWSPYGNKSLDFIEQRAIAICQFFIHQGVKAIVVACNTATVSVVRVLREVFDVPIIGVEPAIKPASLSTKTGHVGVLATTATLASRSFNNLLDNHRHAASFHCVACVGLANVIEQGNVDSPETRQMLQQYLQAFEQYPVDSVVLGCTHYPFIKPLLQQLLPEHVQIFDTAEPVANQLKRRLEQEQLLTEKTMLGQISFYCTGNRAGSEMIISRLWEQNIQVNSVTM